MPDLSKNLIVILLVTTILVGCSKKEESFANDAALETESAELSKAIQENIAENPKQLLSPQQSPLEKKPPIG